MKILYRLSAIGALLFGFYPARPAAAQLDPLGPETVVVAGNALGLQCPQVIGHADRSFSVVWSQSPLPNSLSITAQRFDGAGVPAGGLIDVDAGGLDNRLLFDLQVENRGALGDIVTWSSYLNSSPATTWRFDSRILSAAAPVRIITPSYVRQLFPRIVGGYVGAWPAANACSFALLDANGHLTSPAVRLNGAATDYQCVQAAQSANGSFTIDWYHANPPRNNRLRRFGAAAKPLGPESSAEDLNAATVRVSSAPDGRTALAWVDFNSTPEGLTGPIRTQFFGADGRPAGPAVTVDTPPTPANTDFPDAVAMDRLGRELIVWEFVAFDPPAERYSLQLRTPAGAASPILDLGATPVHAGAPFCAAAASAGRTWVVAWRAMQPDGTEAIFVRRFLS
jgi:hypothetical protein